MPTEMPAASPSDMPVEMPVAMPAAMPVEMPAASPSGMPVEMPVAMPTADDGLEPWVPKVGDRWQYNLDTPVDTHVEADVFFLDMGK